MATPTPTSTPWGMSYVHTPWSYHPTIGAKRQRSEQLSEHGHWPFARKLLILLGFESPVRTLRPAVRVRFQLDWNRGLMDDRQ